MANDSKSQSSSNDNVIINTGGPAELKAKSLLHALSEMEQLSAAEYRTDFPQGTIPIVSRFSFFDVAGKTAALSTLITFLLTPFSMCVFDKILPVFGSYHPTFFDKIFTLLLSSANSLCVALLIIFTVCINMYLGKETEKIVRNFINTYVIVKIITSCFLGIIIYFIYRTFFTTQKIFAIYHEIIRWKIIESPEGKFIIQKFFYWVNQFKSVLPDSIIFSLSLHIITALLIYISFYGIAYRKTKKLKKFREEWEL